MAESIRNEPDRRSSVGGPRAPGAPALVAPSLFAEIQLALLATVELINQPGRALR